MRRSLAVSTLFAIVAIVAIVAGCSSDDGDTADTAPSADTSDTAADGGETFELTSPAFADGDDIPPTFSLNGENVSPPLEWTGVPDGTIQLAITVVDPDASNFVHWVIAGLSPVSTGIGEGETPDDAIEALNGFQQPGWDGPSPPAGEPHTYVFTLHALSKPPGVTPDMRGQEAIDLIDDATTATAELRGTFEQP